MHTLELDTIHYVLRNLHFLNHESSNFILRNIVVFITILR